MKSIYLLRHAEPQRISGVAHDKWPLTAGGHECAERLFNRISLRQGARVYASPLLRALQTAEHAGETVVTDARLQERCAEKDTPELGDCWLRQYEDGDFKCPGGESFNEVGGRMAACMKDILDQLDDGESAAVVSHAAAICAYLQRFCVVRVTDRLTKTREIIWRRRRIYTGSLPPLTCVRLTFCQGEAMDIEIVR